jgi:16S rRNA (guanine1516-N2)-methyltransferase
MNELLTIDYIDEALRAEAEQLAALLNLKLERDREPCLLVTQSRLSLKLPGFSPLYADFSKEAWNKRKAEGKKQGLVRACKPIKGLKVIDATAGWGRDAAVLAVFGAEVLMIERHLMPSLLLNDALSRQSDEDKRALSLLLHQGNALEYLQHLAHEEYPHLIYIDPMHPERQKSALVKKDMQALQQFIQPDEDALALIDLAVLRATQRVVVKWPQKSPALRCPSYSVEGKTVRFDVYLI